MVILCSTEGFKPLKFHDEPSKPTMCILKHHPIRSPRQSGLSAYFRCCDYQRNYQRNYQPPPILSFLLLFLLCQCKGQDNQSISNPVK